jgi:hypothetical protein
VISYKEATKRLGQADSKMADRDYVAANALLLEGIALLGDDYVIVNTIDDTGLALVLAEAREREGSFENAAKLRRGVLLSRLELYLEKHGLK